MSIFNDSIPADNESVKLGASRIRGIQTILNSALSQIFDDTVVFLPKFVTSTLLANDASSDLLRAVGSDHIKSSAITLSKILNGVFTADSTGRGKFAAGFVNAALLDPAITFPTGSVDANALAALAVTTAAIAANAVTVPKVGTGVAKLAVGSFAGSNSVSATISGLDFAPDFVIILGGATSNKIGVAFRSEASGSGPIHSAWDNGTVAGSNVTAIQWTSDGFVIVPSNYNFNLAGATHAYIALKA